MSEWFLRGRELVGDNVEVVVVVLVVLASVGGWMTYDAYGTPEMTTERRPAATVQTTGDVRHGATVVNDTVVFQEGEYVSNRSVYYTSLMPVLNGSHVFTYATDASGDLSVNVEAELVLRAVGERQEDGPTPVYWQTTETLTELTVQTVEPGDRVVVPFHVNVSSVAARLERIENELGGGVGQTQSRVRFEVRYNGTVAGEQVRRAARYAIQVDVGGDTYQVRDSGGVTDEYTIGTETVTHPVDPDPLRAYGGPFLLALGTLAIGYVTVGRRQGRFELTDAEREYLTYRDDRSEFDEWISRIRLPPEAFERPRAEADSLADLVDFAIDTDSGVVEDPDEGTYYVVHGEYLYTYSPPSWDASTADEDPLGGNADGLDAQETDDERDEEA